VTEIEKPMREIQQRLRSRPLVPSDLLTLAAITLFDSELGVHGFDDPVGKLRRLAERDPDYSTAPGQRLAAAIFELAGMGGENA
jgi:hypothetical protein